MSFTTSHITFAAAHVPAALLAAALLTGAGAPGMAAVSERFARTRNKVFYRKCAQQLARFGLLCFVLGLAAAAAVVGLWTSGGAAFPLAMNPPRLPAALAALPLLWGPCLGAVALALVLAALHQATWKSLKNNKALHGLIGFAARILSVVATLLVAGLVRALHVVDWQTPALTPEMGLGELLRAVYLPPASSALWPLFVQAALLGCCAAAALGLVYMLMRRNKDDWGRDYYVFALPYAAKWALWFGLLQMAAQGWLAVALLKRLGPLTYTNPVLVLWDSAILLTLVCLGLWLLVARSETPLRQKPTIVLAALLFVCALALEGAALALLA